MVIWFIGMSGAGKTTLASALYAKLKPKTRHLVYLDGDAFRDVFRNDADHSVAGRRKNAERISHMCRVLDSQNIHVIASVLSIFPEWQAWNRKTFNDYFEIFLDIPLATLKRRDVKGLYAGAATSAGQIKNVVGMDIAFPRPKAPDLVIDQRQQETGVEACLAHIVNRLPGLE